MPTIHLTLSPWMQFIAIVFAVAIVIGLFLWRGIRFLKEATEAIGELLRDIRGECLEGDEDNTLGKKVDRMVNSLSNIERRQRVTIRRARKTEKIVEGLVKDVEQIKGSLVPGGTDGSTQH